MRPTDIFPQAMIDELLRLGHLDPNWVNWQRQPDGRTYRAFPRHRTWLAGALRTGADYFGAQAATAWLLNGPKVFRPTAEQQWALEQVSVNLLLEDYRQPFPAVAVTVDVTPFKAVIVYNEPGKLLTACLHSVGGLDDIVTTVGVPDGVIEDSLQRFDEDCRESSAVAHRALRIAVNSCLALAHFGCYQDFLFPKEVESDRRLALEDTPRGDRARKRLPLAMIRLSFSQEVVLHRTETQHGTPQPPTGREMPCHWRRGHWAMVPCGPRHSERRRVFRPAVLVRKDLFVGDTADTSTEYAG